jgi:hypothetical protein
MPAQTAQSFEAYVTAALESLDNLAKGKRTVFGTPIPWVAEPIFTQGFQVAPAVGLANQIILCAYQVPRGYTAILCGLVFGYVGGGGNALPGQCLYTVDVNNPNAAPLGAQPGYVEKDYNQVPFQLGSFVGGPVWPIEFKYDQGETVRIKGSTVGGIPVGAGNFLFGALLGFQWPTMGWEG